MQKIRLQIMLDIEELNALHRYQLEHSCKNISQTISSVLLAYSRLQIVISKLEEKAHEVEKWKLKAEKKVGTDTKAIPVKGAKKNTGSKVISAKSTLGTRKQGGKR